jgi:uncharacterized membrane protein YcgQ (UPF0703/DUF1980 family)
MIIHNARVTGSLSLNGVAVSTETGSFATTGSNNFSGSQIITGSITASAGFKGDGSGITNISASAINGLNLAQIATGSVTVSVSLTGFSVNANTSVTGSVTATSFTGSLTGTASYASYASSSNLLDGLDSSVFAQTGSNTFTGTQYTSNTTNSTGFSSTAALYTDGGMRVTKDAYVSGTIYVNNLTVYGTQSVQYITSSEFVISDNIINLNANTSLARFGGIAVYDSGSNNLTGSFLWDSVNNKWIYSNPSGSAYDGGMAMFGPRNTSGLGNEQGTTFNALMKGQGGDHITSSLITDTGTALRVPYDVEVTGSLLASSITGSLFGTASYISPDTFINSASYARTSSFASTIEYDNLIKSASYSRTASFASTIEYDNLIKSASFAITASYVSPNTYIISSSYARTASYASTIEYDNLII